MSKTKLSALHSMILLSAKIDSTQEEIEQLDEQLILIKDWDFAVDVLIERAVAPLFYKKLPLLSNRSLIPSRCKDKLTQVYYLTLSRGIVHYEVMSLVTKLLQENRIDFLVLKGAYLAEKLYKDIALRQFSDLDLLIKEEDGEKAQRVLTNAGFQPENHSMAQFLRDNLGFEHYAPLVYQGVSVELHIRLNHPGEKFEILTNKVFENAEITHIKGTEIKVPDKYDVLIHTCVHLHKHFNEGQVQFTSFNDIVNLLHLEWNEADWKTLIERCNKYKCKSFVFKYLGIVSEYYKVLLPDEVNVIIAQLITEKDRRRFVNYLLGNYSKHFSVETRVKRVIHVQGFFTKLKYFFWMLFPSKKYMIRSYNIKNQRYYWIYYPYRHWIVLRGLWKMISEK